MLYRVNCGGNVYEPSKKMICMSCGGSECQEVVPSKEPMVCVNCGSQIPYRSLVCGRCPACGTYQLRDDKVSYPYGADAVLPFKISARGRGKLKEEFGKKLFCRDRSFPEDTGTSQGSICSILMYDYDSNVDYQAVGTKVRT
ncbi:MAG: hypothetical protein ACLTDF_02505 [Coprococcus sp.]